MSHLRNLDYSVVQQCMHCGLCLPSCPTYDATRLERHSPRGRIALMRSIADGELEATRTFGEEMYYCLGCLACTSACPAGVNYAELFEHARAEVETAGVLRNPLRDAIRRFTIGWLFMDLRRLQLAGRALRLWQTLGLQDLLRQLRLTRLLPKRLREMEALTPDVRRHLTSEMVGETTPARSGRRFRVAMLTGCMQDLIYSEINQDTVEVLARNGCEVHTPAEQHCCGSLHAHNGELSLAQTLARRNIVQFPPSEYDAIISNAGGCGSHLKHYTSLLGNDPDYADLAREWDQKVRDIHEWLDEIGVTSPPEAQPERRVTYHESCHLSHGQKIVNQPRELLRAIPRLTLIELPESNWCCGSAGIYNLTQPEMADQLQARKLDHIRSTGVATVATGNPGCLLQIVNGARRQGMELRVVHPITLLAEAYRQADPA